MVNDKKNVNIELLRIVAMALVVVQHVLAYSGIIKPFNAINGAYIAYYAVVAFANCSINLFALITGFCMANKTYVKPSKFVILWMQSFFYGLVGIAIYFVMGETISYRNIFEAFFPIGTYSYWYVTEYVLLLLIIPIINGFISSCSKRKFQAVLAMLIIAFSFYPTLYFPRTRFGDGHNVMWLAVVYMVGVYLKRYVNLKTVDTRKLKLVGLAVLGILIVSSIFIGVATKIVFGTISHGGLLYAYNSPLMLVMSIIVFVAINKSCIPQSLEIFCQKIGRLTFGVYLWHDNKLMRGVLWSRLELGKEDRVGVALIESFLTIFGIFIIGCALEDIRKHLMQSLEKKAEKIDVKIQNAYKK